MESHSKGSLDKNGWTKVSEIISQPWGAKECSVWTPDGGIIRFSSYEMI